MIIELLSAGAITVGGGVAAFVRHRSRTKSRAEFEADLRDLDTFVDVNMQPSGAEFAAHFSRGGRQVTVELGKNRRHWAITVALGTPADLTLDPRNLLTVSTISTGDAGNVRDAIGRVQLHGFELESIEIDAGVLSLQGNSSKPASLFPPLPTAVDIDKRVDTVMGVINALVVAFELPPQRVGCPVCSDTPLLKPRGELDDAKCPSCAGRFLPGPSAQRVFGEDLGLRPRELRDKVGGARSGACPSCSTNLSPVVVEGRIVDLCTGCGGVWLDAGELEDISGGRYTEV